MMETTPRDLALKVAAITAAAITILSGILEFVFPTSLPYGILSILIFISSFTITYFIFYIAIKRFIYSKIKVIYKTIHNLKKTKTAKQLKGEKQPDMLKEVRQEVIEWAKDYKQEIERLEGQEEYRREFIGNVSHELKTPIFNIQGYLLTLLEGGLEDETINRKYLVRAEKSVQRMINIVEDLDVITKLEMGQFQLDITKVDLLAITKEVIESQELTIKQYKMEIKISGALDNKPLWVMADESKITQVLVNLLVNAIHYGKQKGKIEIKFFDMDENILVEVADNGIGIEEKHLTRLFERFYRVDKSRSREEGGSGLGLSIVKHIVEAHDQTINVRSTPNVGSTFSFTLKKA